MRQFALILLSGLLWIGTGLAQSESGQTVNPSASRPSPAVQQAVGENLKDIHFDFDMYELTPEAQQILDQNAAWLKANPNVTVSIAGNADERGEIVYNVNLSHMRAEVTRDALVARGVEPDRINFATGWGKLYPVCQQSDESCWSQNRRAHFTPGTMLQTETVAARLEQLPRMACASALCQEWR
jgi:peptidoglycan-associated lipoprotein